MTAAPSAARRVGAALCAAGARRAAVKWPSVEWRGRVLEFARDVLGVRALAEHQVEILEEYAADEDASILVCTGQKLGKTEVQIIAAAYDFATEADVRVWLYAPKIDHTNAVFWPRFTKATLATYYPCAECRPAHEAWCALADEDSMDETPRPERCMNCSSLLPSRWRNERDPSRGRVCDWLTETDSESGLRAPDGRSVRAYTGRKEGAKGGFSGKLRLSADECSHISNIDRETWAGNLVGGGKILAFGNLLIPTGWFPDALKPNSKESKRWKKCIQKSSRFSPNIAGRVAWSDGAITEGGRWILFPGGTKRRPNGMVDRPKSALDRPIRGMAKTAQVIANLRDWHGTNLVAARIDATPPAIIEGQLISSAVVTEAERGWTPLDDGSGVLQFGVDVGRARDHLAIAVRRGRKIFDLYAEVLGEEDHSRGVEILMGMVRAKRRPHERRPRVVFDETGHEGSRFGKELRRYVAASRDPRDEIEIIGVQMGAPPRNRRLFDKWRDQLAHDLGVWLRTGSIPPDGELEAEIEATTGERVEVAYGGGGTKWEVLRVITNDELRLIIGRSPNKRNACELAVHDVDGEEQAEEPCAAAPAGEEDSAEASRVVAKPPVKGRPAADIDEFDVPAFSPWDAADGASSALWGRS